MELFKGTPMTNRDYWVMTELFVMLHDGDICQGGDEMKKRPQKNRKRRWLKILSWKRKPDEMKRQKRSIKLSQ